MNPHLISLPPGLTVLERGWLSANNIVFAAAPDDAEGSAVVDTGYVTHSAQTLALIESSLQG
ncbi:MAG: MBL fold metallo-hydrolase, partial [Comamonas sp.]